MALTLESEPNKKYILAPPLPKNSDERVCHFTKHQAKPEFVGSRGPGGEGKSRSSCRSPPRASFSLLVHGFRFSVIHGRQSHGGG